MSELEDFKSQYALSVSNFADKARNSRLYSGLVTGGSGCVTYRDGNMYHGNEFDTRPLNVLLCDENDDLFLVEAYHRHRLPVPRELTERIERRKSEIRLQWRQELNERIAVREKEVAELQSKEEKRRIAIEELETLKAQRDYPRAEV